jgi:hypothetical protein
MKGFTKWPNALGVLIVLLLLTLIIGCQQEPVALPSEPIVPEGFTTYTEESGLFSISYPDDWRTAGVGDRGLQENARKLRGLIIADLPLERDMGLLRAGLGTRFTFDPSVTVKLKPLPESANNLDEIVEAFTEKRVESQRRNHPSYREKEFSQVKLTMEGVEAVIRDYGWTSNSSSRQHRAVKMTMVVGKVVWVVTCITQQDMFKDTLHDVVTSFHTSSVPVPPAFSSHPIEVKIHPEDSVIIRQGQTGILTSSVISLVTEPLKIKVSVSPEKELPEGVDIRFNPDAFRLKFGQTVDVEVTLTVSSTAPPPRWPHWTPPPSGGAPRPLSSPVTETAYYRIGIQYEWNVPTHVDYKGSRPVMSQSVKLRFEEPPPLPPGMMTLQEAQDAVDFDFSLQLPRHMPEGTEPPFIGLTVTPDEPHGVTVHYSTFKVTMIPEPGVTGPSSDAMGERTTIRRRQALIGENRIDWWGYDIHYSIVSDRVPVDEQIKIAESMSYIAPGSGSWLQRN